MSAAKEFLLASGFERANFIYRVPRAQNFFWFDLSDWRSSVGVEATIYVPEEKEFPFAKPGMWALHTRTRGFRSNFDAEKQNDVIREARKRFGGSFHNDWEGTNRYIPLDVDDQGPVGRGLAAAYYTSAEHLAALKRAVPDDMMAREIAQAGGSPVAWMLKEADPSRILYSAVIPFVLAAVEAFFLRSFTVLVRYDAHAQEKLLLESRRVDFKDALSLATGARRPEDVVASWYSFQSLAGIHTAFRDWLRIDVRGLLRQTRPVRRRSGSLDEEMLKLIDVRHGVVHRLGVDVNLGREELVRLIENAKRTLDCLVEFLENEKGYVIRD